MNNGNRLIIIDLMNLAYRAYFSVVLGPGGERRGGVPELVTDLTRRVRDILRNQSPSHMAFVADGEGPGFRNAIYPDYKANRKNRDPEAAIVVKEAVTVLGDVAELVGSRVIVRGGVEADDFISSIATAARAAGLPCYIVSSDKDLAQLVGGSVFLSRVVNGGGYELYDEKKVEEKFGVSPAKLTDYMALVGDASDNIPGVKGIGPKGAVELLEAFGTLEDLLARSGEIAKAGLRKKIDEGRDMALLSRRLVEMDCRLDFGGLESLEMSVSLKEATKTLTEVIG